MQTHSFQRASPALGALASPTVASGRFPADGTDEIDLLVDSGVRDLNEIERLLAGEPAHRDELRRRVQEAALERAGAPTDDRSEQLWARARGAWREAHAPLIGARRALSEAGVDDQQSLTLLRAAVEEHLAQARRLGDADPWAVPGPDDHEAGRGASGLHVLDALVAGYLDELGKERNALRTVSLQAAEEIRTRGRARWASWAAAPGQGPPPWERWRNRALFPTILARVLWLGQVQDHVARVRAKPPGTIYAVFRSIARVSSSQLELGLDDQGRRVIVRQDRRQSGAVTVADVPALPEVVFAHGLKLLGSCYTLPTVEWLVERAHLQALQGADRPDIIEVEGGWEAFTGAVLEKSEVNPRERAAVRSLARMLASTPIRWQDGARSSSLFMLFENPSAAGRGRGRSVIRFTLDARLLEHEHHRARERFGPGAGPAQWADWRIVPLPRPRIVAPLAGSPHDTYGPQTVALRLLWLFFTRHGDQLLDGPQLVQIGLQDRRTIAEEAQLPARLIEPLLAHFVRQEAIIAGARSRFAPADPAARAFIADGWRRSRIASQQGRTAASRSLGTHAPR